MPICGVNAWYGRNIRIYDLGSDTHLSISFVCDEYATVSCDHHPQCIIPSILGLKYRYSFKTAELAETNVHW